MTKARKPTSIHAAIFTICETIGWDVAGEVCRSETGNPLSTSQMRKYTDPDDCREISLLNAIRLDIAFNKKGGTGFPISEAIKAKIMRECEIEDEVETLIELASDFAKESGQAISAVLDASMRPHEKATQVEEALSAAVSLSNHLEGK